MLSLLAISAAAAERPDRLIGVAMLGAAVLLPPWITAPAVAAAAWRLRPAVDPFDEVVLLQATAAELRAGRSLRQAIVEAAGGASGLALDRVMRLARAGRPMEEVSRSLADSLRDSGPVVGIAVGIAAHSGGRVAAVFSTLAAIQADRIDLHREVRAATAGVRASVFVVAALPAVALVHAHVTGRLRVVLDLGTPGVVVLVTGVALLSAGVATVVAMVRSAR